ncbi:YegP family protein [Nocardia sp. NPDC056100]|uniref:YegP family protein n=1 Tax=Nocardia sp. NPDC056100 TaxID=3345712 RepID=UPI0035D9C7F3
MAGKFELFADAADKFRWRLKAANGEVIAQSQAYASKDAAKKGISSVQTNAAGAALVDLTDAK